MKKTWFIGLLVAAVLLSGCYGPKTAQPATTPQPGTGNSVEIKGYAFNPATLTITKGTTVTWTNRDSVTHTVTGKGFDSGDISPGGTFKWTFNEAGTFDYGCSIHPSMAGKITVT